MRKILYNLLEYINIMKCRKIIEFINESKNLTKVEKIRKETKKNNFLFQLWNI